MIHICVGFALNAHSLAHTLTLSYAYIHTTLIHYFFCSIFIRHTLLIIFHIYSRIIHCTYRLIHHTLYFGSHFLQIVAYAYIAHPLIHALFIRSHRHTHADCALARARVHTHTIVCIYHITQNKSLICFSTRVSLWRAYSNRPLNTASYSVHRKTASNNCNKINFNFNGRQL